MKDNNLNETDYLMQQMRVFLDQANYDNEQLANVSALMDLICYGPEVDSNYPVSVHVDLKKYENSTGKQNRCKAIDEAMNAMFGVFKRAAFNKSEPLDFSVIHFYPDPVNTNASYNLTDLINTSWIKSDALIESVCNITKSVKDYVAIRTSNSTAQDRSQQQHTGLINSFIEFLDRLLNPILGLQKRLYWESNNRLEQAYVTIGGQLSSLRNNLGRTYKNTRERISGVFSSSESTSSTNSSSTISPTTSSTISSTTSAPSLNQTKLN